MAFLSATSLPAADTPKNLLPAADAPGWTFSTPETLQPSGHEVESLTIPDAAGTLMSKGPALVLHTEHDGTYGKWTALVQAIRPGNFYEFSVWQQAQGVDFDNVRTPLILSWFRDKDGKDELQRDYIDEVGQGTPTGPEGWQRRFRRIKAPANAKSVRVELGLRWAKGARVRWASPQFIEVPPPSPKPVRLATTRIVPPPDSSVEKNTALMAEMLDKVAAENPDLVLFSENLVDRNVRRPLQENAQTIPGPLTDMLSEKARRHRMYIITTLHEVDAAGRYYNTAVLIDREGRVAGKYRKVHLTMGEADKGMLPGNDYPVFDTDFGRIGIMICWDNWFPETARILRLNGAEMIFLPIAGDGVPGHWEAVSRTRAFDNGVYLISSATVSETPSAIINPAGEIVAQTTGASDYVVREINLHQEWRVRYLSVSQGVGEAKSLYIQERRPDTYPQTPRP